MTDEFAGGSDAAGWLESGELPDNLQKFYCASRDPIDKSQTTVQIHVWPRFTSEIAQLVASRIIPEYRTNMDVYRDVMMIGLMVRAKQINDQQFSAVVSSFSNVALADDAKARVQAAHQIVDSIQSAWSNARGKADRDIVAQQCRQILTTEQNEWVRDQLAGMLSVNGY